MMRSGQFEAWRKGDIVALIIGSICCGIFGGYALAILLNLGGMAFVAGFVIAFLLPSMYRLSVVGKQMNYIEDLLTRQREREDAAAFSTKPSEEVEV